MKHIDALAGNAREFHIFHALRVIEAEYDQNPRLGTSARPREDLVRLGQEAELAFPTSTISEFEPASGDSPARLTNRFFGLFGPNGPLPLHLTEYARDQFRNQRDPTFVAFANIFTHRMLSLLYRAWATGQPAPSFDRPGDDPFEEKVAALSGYLGEELRDRDPMPDLAKRHFAGRLASGAKNAEGLLAIISGFFRAPVRMDEFVGSWLELEPHDRWKLGSKSGLGRATSLGQRVWSRAAKFRLRIGPVSLKDYQRMLPGSTSLARLEAVVRNYAGDALDWDVNLVLAGDEVPEAILGQNAVLGHTCWTGRRAPETDADDLFLFPREFSQQSGRL
jgi:type VI secretion system protein ImpH